MSEINRVELLGNLGKDPERRTVATGIVVGCFIGYRICLLAKFGMFGRSNV
jgi:single-stranded DNA-binding protein